MFFTSWVRGKLWVLAETNRISFPTAPQQAQNRLFWAHFCHELNLPIIPFYNSTFRSQFYEEFYYITHFELNCLYHHQFECCYSINHFELNRLYHHQFECCYSRNCYCYHLSLNHPKLSLPSPSVILPKAIEAGHFDIKQPSLVAQHIFLHRQSKVWFRDVCGYVLHPAAPIFSILDKFKHAMSNHFFAACKKVSPACASAAQTSPHLIFLKQRGYQKEVVTAFTDVLGTIIIDVARVQWLAKMNLTAIMHSTIYSMFFSTRMKKHCWKLMYKQQTSLNAMVAICEITSLTCRTEQLINQQAHENNWVVGGDVAELCVRVCWIGVGGKNCQRQILLEILSSSRISWYLLN